MTVVSVLYDLDHAIEKYVAQGQRKYSVQDSKKYYDYDILATLNFI